LPCSPRPRSHERCYVFETPLQTIIKLKLNSNRVSDCPSGSAINSSPFLNSIYWMATAGGSGTEVLLRATTSAPQRHLIVAREVTNSGSDRAQLANMARQAKARLLSAPATEAETSRANTSSPNRLITSILPRRLTGFTGWCYSPIPKQDLLPR
jgi:hypothetical protein